MSHRVAHINIAKREIWVLQEGQSLLLSYKGLTLRGGQWVVGYHGVSILWVENNDGPHTNLVCYVLWEDMWFYIAPLILPKDKAKWLFTLKEASFGKIDMGCVLRSYEYSKGYYGWAYVVNLELEFW